MQFFSAKKILLLVDTYQRKSAGNAEKSYIQQRLQQLSLGTFKNCISTLTGFIINNIRRILLTIVATFFFHPDFRWSNDRPAQKSSNQTQAI